MNTNEYNHLIWRNKIQPKFTGEYSCLLMELTLKREFSYYMLTIYVPTCMLVIVSWFSFWIDPKAVPARVALGVTTLLTMSTKTASISNSLPPVAYTKVRQTNFLSKNNFNGKLECDSVQLNLFVFLLLMQPG